MKVLKLSIIIPCLNEADNITATLNNLQAVRKRGHEIILSDGGSTDATVTLATPLVDQHLKSAKGRAIQMNGAAKIATGDVLCFLHGDTIAPDNIDLLITEALSGSNKIWGRFNVRLCNSKWQYRIIEKLMNIRSCISGVATGDQGIFVCRNIFDKLSGYADIPLMEDIEISKRLCKISRPVCIKSAQMNTSSRRWEKNGIFKTILLMWSLRLRYFLGSPASTLAKRYQVNVDK